MHPGWHRTTWWHGAWHVYLFVPSLHSSKCLLLRTSAEASRLASIRILLPSLRHLNCLSSLTFAHCTSGSTNTPCHSNLSSGSFRQTSNLYVKSTTSRVPWYVTQKLPSRRQLHLSLDDGSRAPKPGLSVAQFLPLRGILKVSNTISLRTIVIVIVIRRAKGSWACKDVLRGKGASEMRVNQRVKYQDYMNLQCLVLWLSA